MPGSGRGFLFAVANVWACFLGFLLILVFHRNLIGEDSIQQWAIQRGMGPFPGMTPEIVLSSAVCCFFVTWFLAVIYLAMHFFYERRKREWSTGVGPLISLIAGALLVALTTIGSFVLHFNFVGFGARNETSPFLVVNWYWATVDISQGRSFSAQLLWFGLFAVQAMVIILVALIIAARELLCRPIPVPERVAVELQTRKSKMLPVGESIEEIFGDLNSEEQPEGS